MRLVCPLLALAFAACDTPHTMVVIDNDYDPASGLVVYRAFWQAVSFPDPIAPGAPSDPKPTVAASPNTAYALLAPGWDPSSPDMPTSFIVLQSRTGFGVSLDQTLHIRVDDDTFTGNCSAGRWLDQKTADFITGQVFAADFALLGYDASTCTTTSGQ